jgi:hypothetical protein
MKQCGHPCVPVGVMEKPLNNTTHTPSSCPEDIEVKLREAVQAAVDEQFFLADEVRDQFSRQLEKLDSKEDRFLDLVAEES